MLSRVLADQSTKTIRSLAITLASLIFALLAVFLLPVIAELPELLQVLGSAITLAGVVKLIEYVLIRIRAKQISGEWIYWSSSGNWAKAHIGVSSGGMTYKAMLYRNKADLTSGENLWAVGEGSLVSYEGGNLYIRYEVKLTSPDYVPRDGFLVLVPDLADPAKMTGFWSRTSELQSSESRGLLTFTRTIPETDPSHV